MSLFVKSSESRGKMTSKDGILLGNLQGQGERMLGSYWFLVVWLCYRDRGSSPFFPVRGKRSHSDVMAGLTTMYTVQCSKANNPAIIKTM
jgi:hypothetical protein